MRFNGTMAIVLRSAVGIYEPDGSIDRHGWNA
jgi:hypothetical protein